MKIACIPIATPLLKFTGRISAQQASEKLGTLNRMR